MSTKDVSGKTAEGTLETSISDLELSENVKPKVAEKVVDVTPVESQPRERKLTQKGAAYRTEICQQKRHRAYLDLSRHMKLIFETLERKEASLEYLEQLRERIDSLKEEFNETQNAFDESLESETEKEHSYYWFDLRDREVLECRLRLSERIRALEMAIFRPPSIRSQKTNSSRRTGVSSRHSSARSMRLEAAAKTARLKAEAAFLESMFSQEREMKRLQLQRKIAISEAEERAVQKIIEEGNNETQTDPRSPQKPNIPQIKSEKNPPVSTEERRPGIDPLAPPFILNNSSVAPAIIPKLEPHEPMFSIARSPAPQVYHGQPQIPTQQFVDPLSETLKQLVGIQSKQTELSSLLANQQRIHSLPVKEPPTFSGDAFDYPAFVTAFDSIISENVTSDKDRLYFLAKYTSGKANDAIKGFLAVNSENAYREARKLLDHRFGNPVHVAEAYKARLRNWPKVKDGDSAGLQAFSDFLIRCGEAVKVVGHMSELDSSQMLVKIGAKLPSYSGVKWCRHAHELQTKSGLPVLFKDIVNFVKGESELANDPVFSPDTLRLERKNASGEGAGKKTHEKSNSDVKKTGSFVTGVMPDSNPARQQSHAQSAKCPLCNKNHDLVNCLELKKKSLDEKVDLIRTKNLCFGCFKAGHRSANCPARLTCDTCHKPHPTLLHGAKPSKRNNKQGNPRSQVQTPSPEDNNSSSPKVLAVANANVCNATSAADSTTSMIVPVTLHHQDQPDLKVQTYALLDDGSDSTFVMESLLRDIQVSGTEVTLRLNTMYGENRIKTQRVDGLVVQTTDNKISIHLPKTYSRVSIPARKDQIPSPKTAQRWPHLQRIKDKISPINEDLEVGLLIGCNCPQALKPKEVIPGKKQDPYAIRTALGWGIIGPTGPEFSAGGEDMTNCNRILTREIGSERCDAKFVLNAQTKETLDPNEIKRMFELDFSEHAHSDKVLSQEDKQFLKIVEQGIRFENGHYVIPLPLKPIQARLPNNRLSAVNRMKALKKRFESNDDYRAHYVEFMAKITDNGYAEEVPYEVLQTDNPTFYINHHGVYNEKKGKIRVVFNCSQQYHGKSLNDHLLQGPDLTNTLLGVLCRFRRAPVAVMGDIESMFYQVKVPKEDRDLLRFLWWPNGDTSRNPLEYRMTVHLFGATSSPGCSNFALKATANDNETELGTAAAEFVRRDFYVDDGLTSVDTVEEAIELVKNVKEMCRRGGFNLRKFTSNRKEVLEQIPIEDRAEDVKNMDLGRDAIPVERALGVRWCPQLDVFQFHITLKDRPITRRGILSTISAIFDPQGFVAPVLLEGKTILQELCRNSIGWDDPVPEELRVRWTKWRNELEGLANHSIPRCYRPADFGKPVKAELHHFSDASLKGYGQCSYLRQVNDKGRVHCAFVMGKARVAPLKSVTVPRLELTAAVLSARVSRQLKRELDIELSDEIFWTDSKVVLGYIANSVRRFHIYVANRVQEIQEKSSLKQWRYVDTESNPADDASRGLRASELSKAKWSQGPEFLQKPESEWPSNKSSPNVKELPHGDPEVRKAAVLATNTPKPWPTLTQRLTYFADWLRAKRAVALCRRYLKTLQAKAQRPMDKARLPRKKTFQPLSVQEIHDAEIVILKAVQDEAQIDTATASPLGKLDPYADTQGIIRVGGRLKFSSLPRELTNPVILPKSGHVTDLIARHHHQLVNHQGKGSTLNEIRANGYWIIGASAVVSSLIYKCVTCRKLRGRPQEQRMSDLPEDRLEPAPPFTYSAVDYFGPFLVKDGRKELKRYGVLFTCMASRAVHVEVANTLETDSFICALRRFICRRGPIRQLRSDQGTNFVGAKNELKVGLEGLDNNKIANELQRHKCDWFTFRMNVPSSSHMGGVWERQVRSVRNVLNAILEKNGSQLNDEALRTFLCEAEATVNSRPLTVDTLNDPLSLSPLTPNHLLTLKTKVVLPPPGEFQEADQYSRKRWRRVQHLSNEFWTRWKKEFLLTLQQRQKWSKVRRDMCVGDVVIIQDDEELPRNKWQLARVAETYPSADGRVRKVKLTVADSALDRSGKRIKPVKHLDRPVQKLILLQSSET